MPTGPGKYDDLATLVRQNARARFAGVIILDGHKGSGYSMQSREPTPELLAMIPKMLRDVADEVEKEVEEMRKAGAS